MTSSVKLDRSKDRMDYFCYILLKESEPVPINKHFTYKGVYPHFYSILNKKAEKKWDLGVKLMSLLARIDGFYIKTTTLSFQHELATFYEY